MLYYGYFPLLDDWYKSLFFTIEGEVKSNDNYSVSKK